MSSDDTAKANIKIDFILPRNGKLFYEEKDDLMFCKPLLLSLKSVNLEKLEKMQKAATEQLQETRIKTAAAKKFA